MGVVLLLEYGRGFDNEESGSLYNEFSTTTKRYLGGDTRIGVFDAQKSAASVYDKEILSWRQSTFLRIKT